MSFPTGSQVQSSILDEDEGKSSSIIESPLNPSVPASAFTNIQHVMDIDDLSPTCSVTSSWMSYWKISEFRLETLGPGPLINLVNPFSSEFIRYILGRRSANALAKHAVGGFKEGNITLEAEVACPSYALTETRLKELSAAQEATGNHKPSIFAMMPSTHSRVTESSEDGNEFIVDVRLRDVNGGTWILPARIDTQAARSFICGGTLSEIGPLTAIVLPPRKILEFQTPIGNVTTKPTHFIEIMLEFELAEIGSMGARLRIMKDADDHGIILGRDFLADYKKKTKRSLLKLVEEYQPNSSSTTGNRFFGVLRKSKKLPAQIAIDDAYKEQHKRNHEAFKSLPYSMTTSENVKLEKTGPIATLRNADLGLVSGKGPESNQSDWKARGTSRTNTSSTQGSSIFDGASLSSSTWTEVSSLAQTSSIFERFSLASSAWTEVSSPTLDGKAKDPSSTVDN